MGKVSKALEKFGNTGGHTNQSDIEKLLVRSIEQEDRKKLSPRSKRTALPLFCMLLAGFILGFLLSSVDDRIPAVSIANNLDADQPIRPLLVMSEKAELAQPLPTIPGSKYPALKAKKAGTEEQLTANDVQDPKVANAPPITVSQALSRKEEVNVFLQGWKNTWEQSAGPEGNVTDYFSYYAYSFSDGLIDKAAWQKDKTRKNIRKAWIKIELEQVSLLEQSDGSIHVRFVQQYRSSNYSENSNKTLILIREDGELKILSEFEGHDTYSNNKMLPTSSRFYS